MSGMPIYQDSPAKLKNQIYAYDGSNVVPLRSNSAGQVSVITEAGSSVTVTATDLDIRNLSQAQDTVGIYGTDGTTARQLKTDATGIVQVGASDLDIRNLSQAQDTVGIYGTDGTTARQLKTDADGIVQVGATDLDIRNLSQAQDTVGIYGTDGTTARQLKTDAGGIIQVGATDLDIRNLSQAQDTVGIYGTDGTTARQLKTDENGVLQVSEASSFYNPVIADITVSSTDEAHGGVQEIATLTSYAYCIKNASATAVSVEIGISLSPDNTIWVKDVELVTLTQNESIILSPNKFLRYARLDYKLTAAGDSATLKVFFQAQS